MAGNVDLFLSADAWVRSAAFIPINSQKKEDQPELLYPPPLPTGRYPISEAAVRNIASLLSWGRSPYAEI